MVYIIFDPHPVGEVWREKEKREKEVRGEMSGRKNGSRTPNLKGGNKNEG